MHIVSSLINLLKGIGWYLVQNLLFLDRKDSLTRDCSKNVFAELLEKTTSSNIISKRCVIMSPVMRQSRARPTADRSDNGGAGRGGAESKRYGTVRTRYGTSTWCLLT